MLKFDPIEISHTINRLRYLAREFDANAADIAGTASRTDALAHQWAEWLTRYADAMRFYADDAERIFNGE